MPHKICYYVCLFSIKAISWIKIDQVFGLVFALDNYDLCRLFRRIFRNMLFISDIFDKIFFTLSCMQNFQISQKVDMSKNDRYIDISEEVAFDFLILSSTLDSLDTNYLNRNTLAVVAQTWALSVFLNLFTNEEWMYCIFVKLIT